MKKQASIALLRRTFSIASILIAFTFVGFIGYLYFSFIGPITGDVVAPMQPDLLKKLETKKFDGALARMQKRQAMPDVPADLKDPYRLQDKP